MKPTVPREYLSRVVEQWSAFCKSHRPFERAIKDLLAENALLRRENDRLKEELIIAREHYYRESKYL